MTIEIRKITVSSGSELAALLEQANDQPLLLEKDGRLYRLAIEELTDIWSGYDPEQARKAIARTAGSWNDIDTDELVAAIYRARDQGSRPTTKPDAIHS